MPHSPKIERTNQNLRDALRRNLKLLKEYSYRAFVLGDQAFLGEVAGKLRVLVYRSHHNKPLLLDMMEHNNVNIMVPIDDPSGEYQLSLDEYLAGMACVIRTQQQGLVEITNRDLVAVWSQQYGAAHEDWAVDEEFASLLTISSMIEVSGLPIAFAALRAISKTVLWVGEEFLRISDDATQDNTFEPSL